MTDLDTSIKKLVAELPKRIKLVIKDQNRGHLYHALKLVAEVHKREISDFLNNHQIGEEFNLYEDEQVLIKLGFPKHYLQTENFFGTTCRENVNYLLITAASFIVLSVEEPRQQPNVPVDSKPVDGYKETERQSSIQTETASASVATSMKQSNVSVHTKTSSASVATTVQKDRRLSLALVLKGKLLENIESQTILPLNEVKRILGIADYFLCTSQQTMIQIKQELSLTSEVDREFEQQVLVVIFFKSELEKGKTFANKLELTPYLQKGNEFKVNTVETLTKVSGITKLGFVRS